MDIQEKFVKEIDLKEIHIGMRADGIVCVRFKKNSVLDIPLQLSLLSASQELVENKLSLFLFEAEEGVTITKEARDNAVNLEDESPYRASAVVVQNIAYALIANFYMKFNKPKRPYKVFNKKNDAIEWLKQFV